MNEQLRKMLEQAPKTLVEQIKEEAPALVAMVTSRGYELWELWAEATEHSLKDNAIFGDDLVEREEARHSLLALRRLRAIPPLLADMARSLGDSSDGPVSGPDEVGEASQDPS